MAITPMVAGSCSRWGSFFLDLHPQMFSIGLEMKPAIKIRAEQGITL